MEQVSQPSVRYRPATDPAIRCATCVMFHANTGRCDLVAGDIGPGDVCDRWEPRPLPRTPGDLREDHAEAAAAAVAAIYVQAELVITAAIATLARKVAAGAMLPAVASRRLQGTVNSVLSAAAPKVRREVDEAMHGAAEAARESIISTVGAGANPAQAVPDTTLFTQPLAALLDTAGDTAAQSAREALTSVTAAAMQTPDTPAIPPPSSPYQAAIGRAFDKHAGFPGSTLSYRRIQAAQTALDDLASQGITGFTDKAGRQWDLASYVEMATRTAVSNAWDDMQAAIMTRSGLDLVKTGTHSTEGSCKLCVPWLNRELSLTGATPGYPTVDEAKAAGWRHPSCRCFFVPVGVAIAVDVTNPVDLEQAAAVYKASQKQRALERRVRAAGRAYHAAITPQAKTRARRDLAAARASSDAHRQRHHLRMMKVTVHRRERPFGAR